jgi:DNA-binding CsgD family transcriptional regulator
MFTEKQRNAIRLLRYLKTQSLTASALGITRESVNRRLARAADRLRAACQHPINCPLMEILAK